MRHVTPILLAAAALLAACGSTPVAAPSAVAAKPASAAPASAAPGSAAGKPSPAASSAAASAAAQSQDWDKTLAAAKQEGKVSIFIPIGDELHAALVDAFEKQYGIQVDALSVQGPEAPPRVSGERNAGKYLWDMYIGGTTSVITGLLPIQPFDPIEPALMLPEVTNMQNWRGGALEFLDKDRTLMVTAPYQRGTIFINTNLVKPDAITSYKDLLDPKWSGKMVTDDPRHPGPGAATFTFFYLQPDLGPDYIRSLAKQQLLVMGDYTQEADAIGQGKNPILIGGNDYSVEPLIAKGIPAGVVSAKQLKEGTDLNAGSSGVALFNKAPHPNAAKVYLNWLLTKQGQTGFVRALGYVSARLDVPTDHVEP